MLLRARSLTAFALTVIVTSSSSPRSGVMVRVYSVSSSVSDFSVAVAGPVMSRSVASNPLTSSEKVMVMSKATFFSIVGIPVMSVTLGTIVST